MTWREFIRDNVDTLGVVLFFAALGSFFMLKARESATPFTPARALLVLLAGQVVGTAATAFVFGYLGWNIFVAPVVGTLCGLLGFFMLLTVLKAGERVEQRGADIGDIGIDILDKRRKEN